MKPYPNEELERMSKREIIRLYKRTVEQFNDAVPVIHGKWKLIRMEDNGDGFYTCSNCDRGDIHSPLVTVPYCWYCGAKMDAERKEE